MILLWWMMWAIFMTAVSEEAVYLGSILSGLFFLKWSLSYYYSQILKRHCLPNATRVYLHAIWQQLNITAKIWMTCYCLIFTFNHFINKRKIVFMLLKSLPVRSYMCCWANLLPVFLLEAPNLLLHRWRVTVTCDVIQIKPWFTNSMVPIVLSCFKPLWCICH